MSPEWMMLSKAQDFVREHRDEGVDSARADILEAAYKGEIYTRGQVGDPRVTGPFLINPPAWKGLVPDFDANLILNRVTGRRPRNQFLSWQFARRVPLVIHDVRVHVPSLIAWIEKKDAPPLPQLSPLSFRQRQNLWPAVWDDTLPHLTGCPGRWFPSDALGDDDASSDFRPGTSEAPPTQKSKPGPVPGGETSSSGKPEAKKRHRAQRDNAIRALKARYGDKVPTGYRKRILAEVNDRLKKNGDDSISEDTLRRALEELKSSEPKT